MFLIIDQGTTSTKVMLFNLEGKKVDSSQKPFKQRTLMIEGALLITARAYCFCSDSPVGPR